MADSIDRIQAPIRLRDRCAVLETTKESASCHVEWAQRFNAAHSPLHTGRETREEAGTDKLEGEDQCVKLRVHFPSVKSQHGMNEEECSPRALIETQPRFESQGTRYQIHISRVAARRRH
ncbi:unnamed protein product [Leuciscus chuanchicus]